jgi:hypothetical protein
MSIILSNDGAVLFFTPLVHKPALLKTLSIGAEVDGAAKWLRAGLQSGFFF